MVAFWALDAPMLPIPPLIAVLAGTAGLIALGRVLAKEWRRVNGELHAQQEREDEREPLRKLKRDPKTGVYRVD
jgi:hypothetical protein